MKLTVKFKTNNEELKKLFESCSWERNANAEIAFADTQVYDNILAGVRVYVRPLDNREGNEDYNFSWGPISSVYNR